MESPPRLGLGTINIVPFVEGLIYYQSMCSEFRYGERKVLGTQPYPTCGFASTHYVLHFNLIKGTFNIHHSRLTHASIHLSIQHDIFIPNPNIYIYIYITHSIVLHLR